MHISLCSRDYRNQFGAVRFSFHTGGDEWEERYFKGEASVAEGFAETHTITQTEIEIFDAVAAYLEKNSPVTAEKIK